MRILDKVIAAARDTDYCYTFLHSMVCLSVVCLFVCHNRAPCLIHSADLDAIW